MKTLFIKLTVAAALLLSSVAAGHAENLFRELAELPYVESVYVGKAMIKAGLSFINDAGNNVKANIYNTIKDIDSIEIISCDDTSKINELKAKAGKIMARRKLEVQIMTKEDGESTVIYGRAPENGQYISDIVIETTGSDEFNLIHISGTINLNELKAMVAQKK